MNIYKIKNNCVMLRGINAKKINSTLGSTLCSSTKTDTVQIFQVYPPRNNVSISDVQDVMNITADMNAVDKKIMYDIYGIDHEKVDKYYNTVMYLERMYSIRTDGSTSVGVDLLHHLLLSVWRLAKACLLMLFGRL